MKNKLVNWQLWLRHGWLVILACVGMACALIWSGFFDPSVLGQLQSERSLSPLPVGVLSATQFALDEAEIQWQPEQIAPPTTIQLNAQTGGNGAAAYGLLFGTSEHHIGVGVNDYGFATVWETQLGIKTLRMPWQTWPHLAAKNHFWVNWETDQIVIRINEEILWQGSVSAGPECRPCNSAIWGVGYDEATVIDFGRLQIFGSR